MVYPSGLTFAAAIPLKVTAKKRKSVSPVDNAVLKSVSPVNTSMRQGEWWKHLLHNSRRRARFVRHNAALVFLTPLGCSAGNAHAGIVDSYSAV